MRFMTSRTLTRRDLVQSTAVLAAGVALTGEQLDAQAAIPRYAARPPAGFVRTSTPGRVARVNRSNTLQANGLWPKPDAAKRMLERVMSELTGEADMARAFGKFVHPEDVVAIKPNGIAGRRGQTMAANKELILEVVKGVMAAGVPAERITIFEQYRDFLWGTRVVTDKNTLALAPEFPSRIKTAVHLNKDASMGYISVAGIPTKYVRPFTEATAVINISQIKDHSICGFTGALKNITHGCNINPHAFHEHRASPQIAHLYAQEVVKSRVVLHIIDAFKVIYDGGPLDKKPECRVPYEAVFATTDPVAMDVIGWGIVEELRKKNGLPSLTEVGREPSYIRVAADLGLGMFERSQMALLTKTI